MNDNRGKRLVINEPKLMNEWDFERNQKNGLYPESISIGSHKIAYWICSTCGNHYSYLVRDKFRSKIGCPICAKKARSVSNRLTKISGKAPLAITHPELVEEWVESIGEEFTPVEVTANSNKQVRWKCKKCGGIYIAYIPNRAMKGSGCPYCAGIACLPGFNDLLTVNPLLAEEWSDKNNCLPSSVLPHSHKKVYWKCVAGHPDFLATVKARTYGQGCPICAMESHTSFSEQAIFFFLQKVFPDAKNRYKYNNKVEIDIYIPSLKVGIEYNGYYAHRERIEQDINKRKFLLDEGIKFYVVKEYKKEDEINGAEFYIPADHNFSKLDQLIIDIINSLDKNNDLVVDVNKNSIEIKKQYLSIRKENSITSKMPGLIDEWDYEKNGNISPDFVSIGSHQKYFWKCHKCGQSYLSEVKSHFAGSGCPYCSGKKLLVGVNDLETRYPTLAQSWDYEKNKVKPSEVYGGGNTSYYWKCEKGHSYRCSLSNRIRGRGCPYCAGKKVLQGYNDFQTVRPEDALDWDYELNDCLPSEIHYNSQSKIIYWKCHKCGFKWQSTVRKKYTCKNCIHALTFTSKMKE